MKALLVVCIVSLLILGSQSTASAQGPTATYTPTPFPTSQYSGMRPTPTPFSISLDHRFDGFDTREKGGDFADMVINGYRWVNQDGIIDMAAFLALLSIIIVLLFRAEKRLRK
jgi:hypothetical protein